MEEKKLTDEEIVKSLEYCANSGNCERGKCLFTKHEEHGRKNFCFGYGSELALDLIHRLQDENAKQKAEIERLTEELDLANETIDRNNKRYEKVSIERQKALDRVDFLEDALLDKIRRNEELITAIKQAEQQAVKDTAKEILQELYETPHEYHEKKILEIAKRKGVEVE